MALFSQRRGEISDVSVVVAHRLNRPGMSGDSSTRKPGAHAPALR